MSNSYVSIYVQDIEAQVRIGLLEAERTAPQRLHISVEVFASPHYLQHDGYMDYARIYNAVKAWEDRPHTDLLETLMNDLIAVAFTFPEATAVRASISKPDIFDHAQQAGIKCHMARETYNALSPQ